MDVKGKLTLTCSKCGNDFEKEINITMLERWDDVKGMIMKFDTNIDFSNFYSGYITCHSCIEQNKEEIIAKYGSHKKYYESIMIENLFTDMKEKYGEKDSWDSDRKEFYEQKIVDIKKIFEGMES